MYYFYTNNSEKHNAWKNRYEIQAAALEHEKRRFQRAEDVSLAIPQVLTGNQPSGWAAILQAPLRLLAILIG